MASKHKLTKGVVNAFPKIVTHNHIDCAVRPSTQLELSAQFGFSRFGLAHPQDIVADWLAAGTDEQRAAVAARYQRFIKKHASKSLPNYLQAIGDHILPIMQTPESVTRITREVIEDDAACGVIYGEYRFAPQLHLQGGMKIADVMEAAIAGLRAAPIPAKLVVCALRHENGRMARRLADACVKFKEHVAKFDLAGGEEANPGVLLWFAKQAHRIQCHGIDTAIHLWETNDPTDEDVQRLRQYNIKVLAHGCRGNRQGRCYCGICWTSNRVTGQIKRYADHNVGQLFNAGKRVMIDIDGTLFTGTDMTREYMLYHRELGWGADEFYRCNIHSLGALTVDASTRRSLRKQLRAGYGR